MISSFFMKIQSMHRSSLGMGLGGMGPLSTIFVLEPKGRIVGVPSVFNGLKIWIHRRF